MRRMWVAGAAILICLALGGVPAVGQSPAPGSPAPSASAALPAPLEALAYAPPADTILFSFTDWAAMKAAHGAADVTSASPSDRRQALLRELVAQEAPRGAYGLNKVPGQADTWGWDTTDLAWEAEIDSGSGLPAFVLRLRDDLDLAPLQARFDARGFSRETYAGATVRSHPFDGSDWLRGSDPSIVNTAILPDGHTLVISGSLDAVHAALDAAAGRQPWEVAGSSAGQALQALGSPWAATVAPGLDACLRVFVPPFPALHLGSPLPDPNAALLAATGPLSPYWALAMGYARGPSGTVDGRVVFVYASPTAAAADLEGRRLATEGVSARTGTPFAEGLFTLTDASVQGHDLVLDVAPVGDRPGRLRQMLDTRDMLFATCG
jgi:hypothetical protein